MTEEANTIVVETAGKGNRKSKEEQAISVSLPLEVSAACVAVAEKSGFTTTFVRGLVAAKAQAAADAATVGKEEAIVREHVLKSLGAPPPVVAQATPQPNPQTGGVGADQSANPSDPTGRSWG